MKEKPAIFGGSPVRTGGWPKWPQYSEKTLLELKKVLESGRWAISGPYVGTELFEKKFAQAFAEFCGAKYCVPCDHGSSALLIALEALGIGFGDEVIIPAITWVASATAVVNVNAIPVLVDVDPKTLCIDPAKVEAAITEKTKAIMPVHLYSGMCDMDRLLEISEKYQIPILEDCAHVHGAKWGDRYAGTVGKCGAFSMQQGKGLTSGEGGAVLTNDNTLFTRLQQLRADSRSYTLDMLERYDMELVLRGNIQGTNFCLSEFQSAILLDQLKCLEVNLLQKAKNAALLDGLLSEIGSIMPLATYRGVSQRAYYCYTIRIDRNAFGQTTVQNLCQALKKELNLPFFPIYEPLNRVGSYNPSSKKRNHISEEHLERLDFSNYSCPEAEKAFEDSICMPHWVLLGDSKDMEDIAISYQKIKNYYRND